MAETPSPRLENLVADGQRRELNPAYSRLVRRLRLILPLAAVVLVMSVFTWIILERDTVVEKNPDNSMQQARNELVSARFESVDEEGRPYEVTAQRAVQGKPEDGQDEKMIYLTAPRGKFTVATDEAFEISAPEGAYHQQKETLSLTGGVSFGSQSGYALRTQAIEADLKAGTARSGTRLTGNGPSGSVEAQGFSADNKRGMLVLKGPARVIIKPEAL